MKKVEKVIEMSPETLQALERLAKITGAEEVGQLIQDALRTLEWVVFHQSLGNKVAVVSSAGDILETLAPVVEPEAIVEAQKYFKSA